MEHGAKRRKSINYMVIRKEKRMTVNEVIKINLQVLSAIRVPVSEMDNICIPIARVISDLKKCVQFLDGLEEQANKEQKTGAPIPQAEAEDPEAHSGATESAADEDLFGETNPEKEKETNRG